MLTMHAHLMSVDASILAGTWALIVGAAAWVFWRTTRGLHWADERPTTRGRRNPWVRGDAADPFWALLIAVMFCVVVGVAVLALP
jgi:hypothetical protein